MENRTKYITTLAMLTAIAYVAGATIRVRSIMPAAPFLTYDPKDVVILLGGFMLGPIAALTMSVVLALLEMVTISDSGPIGALMNALASASFTCTAVVIYWRTRSIRGAIAGLVLGCLVATITMLAWNYVMIPIYQPWISRETVANLILPALLPFNLIKTSLNAALALLLYKHVSRALKTAGLYGSEADVKAVAHKQNIVVAVTAGVVALALVVTILVLWLYTGN